MAKYMVTEIITWASGSIQTPTWAYDTEQGARGKFHSVLSTAATSSHPVHACLMYTSEGFPLAHECYKHEVTPEPTPEPEEEEPAE